VTFFEFALALLGLTGLLVIGLVVFSSIDDDPGSLPPPERPIDFTRSRR
jgi:hypothetical protein